MVKKDDDLWSPRHSSLHSQPFFTGLGSESAFLSHFLPAPGNHPSSTVGQLSNNALRADLQRSKHAGEAAPHLTLTQCLRSQLRQTLACSIALAPRLQKQRMRA